MYAGSLTAFPRKPRCRSSSGAGRDSTLSKRLPPIACSGCPASPCPNTEARGFSRDWHEAPGREKLCPGRAHHRPLTGCRLLTTVYDLIPLNQGLARHRLVARAGYGSYLKALGRVDTLFAISNETARDLVDMLGLASHRILVAPPGIDLPASGGGGSSHARPYFLFLGAPDPNKNLSVLLRAMAICSELPEVLNIAGHWLPKQVAALNEVLASRGLRERVHHIGFVPGDELAGLMRDATALVAPSRYEGFGLPVGEGLAAGAAVIHSAIPVLKDTSAGAALTFNPGVRGGAGRLSPPRGHRRRVEQLRRLGAQRAQALTWDAAVQTTLAAYRAIPSPHRGEG